MGIAWEGKGEMDCAENNVVPFLQLPQGWAGQGRAGGRQEQAGRQSSRRKELFWLVGESAIHCIATTRLPSHTCTAHAHAFINQSMTPRTDDPFLTILICIASSILDIIRAAAMMMTATPCHATLVPIHTLSLPPWIGRYLSTVPATNQPMRPKKQASNHPST